MRPKSPLMAMGSPVDYGSYVGTIRSPLFLRPMSARPARQVQLAARFKF